MTVRTKKIAFAAALLVASASLFALLYRPYPSDRTPEGAYMRVARSVADGRMNEVFPYLETDAQWACFTVRDMRKKASARVRESYPEPERSALIEAYRTDAEAGDGSDVFASMAQRRGWTARLKKDLSGVVSTEIEGDRASIVTARGTRYPFRRRENGIWGLTIFTADLVAESERASRDLAMVAGAAGDYDRAAKKNAP